MSNQAKLLISVLFIIAILLGIGLTRFYFNVSGNTDNTSDEERIVEVGKTFSNGMQSFTSSNGLYGLIDEERNIVVEPEWIEILEVTDKMVLVSRRTHGKLQIGGIDYEENVTLPFVFRSIEPVGNHYYIGILSEDDSCVIYHSDFTAAFQDSWTTAQFENDILQLQRDGSFFSYYIGDEAAVPQFRKARMQCRIAGLPLEWSVSNQTYLSELNDTDLIRINNVVPQYIDMLISNDFSELSQLTTQENMAGLSKMDCFPGFVFEKVDGFSFSSVDREGVRDYDFAFTLQYDTTPGISGTEPEQNIPEEVSGNLEQTVQIHLYFRRNTDNQLILTSATLDFHSA
ncbi:MAG: hypothetical protein IJN11_07325 [Oscillospiraceae bacterium]|nr:hypothetical protein [Oscillospiraceae bacterium]